MLNFILSYGVTLTLFVFLSIFIYVIIQIVKPGAKNKYEKYAYTATNIAHDSLIDNRSKKENLGN